MGGGGRNSRDNLKFEKLIKNKQLNQTGHNAARLERRKSTIFQAKCHIPSELIGEIILAKKINLKIKIAQIHVKMQ